MDKSIKNWPFVERQFDTISKAIWIGALITIFIILASFVLGTFAGAWRAIQTGDLEALGNISTFLSALLSMALVLVTLAYVYTTHLLVNETREARNQNERLEREQREREKNALRRALIAEMEEMHAFKALSPDILPEPAVADIFPTTVYEANSDSIGLLTEKEVDAVIRFYSSLMWFKSEMKIFEAAGDDPTELAKRNLENIQEFRDRAVQSLKNRL